MNENAELSLQKNYLPEGDEKRRPYSPPRLIRYGDLRDVTLGGSTGGGESGGGGIRRVRFPGP
jgi:hypothetical protein